jgi:hypothetical protein
MSWDDRTRRIVIWALVKGIIPGVLVAVVSIVLWRIWPRDPRIAAWVGLVGSFGLFLKSYFRDWRLRWFTILLPGVMAVGCCVLQVLWLGVSPMGGAMGIGIGVGVLLGVMRGAGHRIFPKDGQWFAKRTLLVMLVWLGTYLLTQSAALFGWVRVTRWGLSGTVFSTSIVAVFTVVLFGRYLWCRFGRRTRPGPVPTGAAHIGRACAVLLLATGLLVASIPSPVRAQTTSGAQNDEVVYTAVANPDHAECMERVMFVALANLGRVVVAIGNAFGGDADVPDESDAIAEARRGGLKVQMSCTDTTVIYARRLGRMEVGDTQAQIRISVPDKETGEIKTMRIDLTTTYSYGYVTPDGRISGTHTNTVRTTAANGKVKTKKETGTWYVIWNADQTRGELHSQPDEQEEAEEARLRAQQVGYDDVPPPFLLILQTPETPVSPPPADSDPGMPDGQPTGDGLPDGSGDQPDYDDDGPYLSEADIDAVYEMLQSQNLPDEAIGAGLMAGIALLLAGAGLNTAVSIASAIANIAQQAVDDATQAVASSLPPLVDPRDGLVLETDGDQVYWDDDAGWIDRDTAQQWINEINDERHQRDLEVERNLAEWEAGYDERMWNMIHRNAPTSESLNNLANAYNWEDFIDENMHMLSPEMQQHVQDQLNGIDWSDPYNLSADDLNALQHTASAVANIRTGQEWGTQADQMHADIDRAQTNAYVAGVGYGITRFGLTVLNPALGIGASGAYGYMTAPPGSGIKHAAIAAAASGADMLLGGMNPSSVLWNAGTGGAVAGLEQAAYGGNWDQIKNGALFGGVMNGTFALGQRPGVRNFFNNLDDSLSSHLGLNGPKPPLIEGPATFVNDPSTGLPGSGAVEVHGGSMAPADVSAGTGNTVRFLGQGADGTTTALGPRPGLDDGMTTVRPPMDGAQTTIVAPDADAGASAGMRPPADGGQTAIRTPSLDDPAMGTPASTSTTVSPNRPSLDQTQTGMRPPSVDDGAVRPAPSGDELLAQFQAETGVKITGISRDPNGNVRVTFDPDDLTDYSVYPGQRDAAEQLLTDKWVNMHAEAEFQRTPPVYDVPGELQTNHGVNNGIRDDHVRWLTDRDAVQQLPDNYDPDTLPQRSLDDLDRDLGDILGEQNAPLRDRLDAEQDGGHSRTFPEQEGVLNWPEDGSVSRTQEEWFQEPPADVREAQLLADGWTRDDAGWRSPEVTEIVRQHPEINEIDRQIRRAFSESGYGRNIDGDHFTKFQNRLGEHVDMSDPTVREQVARWTYYVADRKTGTPPWFRVDGN